MSLIERLRIPEPIARDLLHGAITEISGMEIGLRKITRAWFNFSSGHYILATDGPVFFWSETPDGPWNCRARRVATP